MHLIYEIESIFIPSMGWTDSSQTPLLPSLIFHLLYDHENTHRRSLHGFGVGELFVFCFLS